MSARPQHARRRLRAAAALTATAAIGLAGLAALAGPASADPVAQPDYYPSGPQTDVPVSTVTDGGWTQCYLDTYDQDLEAKLPDVLSACTGRYLMLAGRRSGSDTLSLLAAARRKDVLTDTGTDQGTTHAANGSEWYFNAHWSWGFAAGGESVSKNECDTQDGALRLCWHTVVGAGGYRVGNVTGLNGSTDYERVVYQSGPPAKAQSITFSTTAPTAPYVGQTYDVAAQSDSGLPVTLASGTPDVCSLEDGTVTFRATGDCTVTADQEGDDTYDSADQATQTMSVSRVPATVEVTPPTDTVSGQQVELPATVSVPKDAPGGVPAGTVQFSVDGQDLGDPVAVDGDGTATSAPTAQRAGQHDVEAVFTPKDEVTDAGGTGEATWGVGQARTTTTLSVAPKSLTASVTPVSPGAGVPTGTVTFRVAGQEVGSADLDHGTATLEHAVEPGQSRAVSAEYAGDDDMAGSADSTTRNDPTVTAKVTSARPRSAAGWYSAPVRIDYTCTPHGAALSTPCPAADTTAKDGAQQSFTHSVSAVDGGLASITTTVDVDKVAPTVAITGPKRGARYLARGPKATCVGADTLSGMASCTLSTRRSGGVETVTATATDKAGNVARTSTSYQVVRYLISGASYSHGVWTTHRGGSFTVESQNATHPTYRLAQSSGSKLARSGKRSMVRTGSDTWAYAPVWNMPRTRSGIWYVGVQEGSHLVALKVHMIG